MPPKRPVATKAVVLTGNGRIITRSNVPSTSAGVGVNSGPANNIGRVNRSSSGARGNLSSRGETRPLRTPGLDINLGQINDRDLEAEINRLSMHLQGPVSADANVEAPRTPFRSGDTLTPYTPLECTEVSCFSKFKCKDWTATKQSLLRHFIVYHSITIKETKFFCTHCKNFTDCKRRLHPCFKNNAICIIDSESELQCNICAEKFPTKRSLHRHLMVHKKEINERRASRNNRNQQGNIDLPVTSGGLGRSNNSISP